MCIQFVYINNSPSEGGYSVVIANNRDEYYTRPTKPAAFWDHDSRCISGLDLLPGREGGTWFGVSKRGKIASLLNLLTPVGPLPEKKARGHLVIDYLSTDVTAVDYLQELSVEGATYNLFNLAVIEKSNSEPREWEMCVYSNAAPTPSHFVKLKDGFYGISNSVYDKPFQKVHYGKQIFTSILTQYATVSQKVELQSALFKMMADETHVLPDEQLKMQGGARICGPLCEQRSAVYVNSSQVQYGTRTTTLVMIDAVGNCDYVEHTMRDPTSVGEKTWDTTEYNFRLESELSKL